MSEVGSVQEEEDSSDDAPAAFRMSGEVTLRTAFLLLDGVDLVDEMRERAIVKSVPRALRGNYRIAMRTALEEICAGHRSRETVREERGWKLFLLLPKMLLHRPARGDPISRSKLVSRFESIVRGDWGALISASRVSNIQAVTARQRKSRRFQNDLERRASRVEALVHMGKLPLRGKRWKVQRLLQVSEHIGFVAG